MHDVHIAEDHHDIVTRVYTEEIVNAFIAQMNEADRLADELQALLMSYESAIEREGMTDQVENLVRLAETYSSGLSTANKISRTGHELLRGLDHRLHPEPSKNAISEESSLVSSSTEEEIKSASVPPKQFLGAARQLGKMIAPVLAPIEHNLSRFPLRTARGR